LRFYSFFFYFSFFLADGYKATALSLLGEFSETSAAGASAE
jgi:hypothetical protein